MPVYGWPIVYHFQMAPCLVALTRSTFKTKSMSKTYGFHVVEATNATAFEQEVKKWLDEGWDLHGSMTAFPMTYSGETEVRYVQAMKKENRPESSLGFRRPS